MEFRILGPVEVLSGGQALDLGGQKQRALLAMLLLDANHIVSSDRLIEALWEEEPPETAQKALQVYISQLRKVLGKERLVTKGSGYLLRVEEGELDLERFQGLAEEGEFREALALWRGQPLADFSTQRFAQVEIARLEELRLVCLEERIDRDLAQGRQAELVAGLEALVSEHPLRERLRAQLMLALYRSGRQAEALEAYQVARSALVDELGIEPGRQLRELHQAILNQDRALDLEPEATPHEELRPEPAQPPPAPEPAGREVRKTVTVLFADVVGSTELGEQLDPESLHRIMGRYFREMRAVLERHGGTVEKFIGDAVMAVFGVPVVHEDDPLRAVKAALEMRERLTLLNEEQESSWGIRLVLRIGLNTGEVVTGGPDAPTYATGDPVNVAARLQQAAQAGEILIGPETQRFVRDSVVAEPVEPLAVKGKTSSVAAFRLLAVTTGAPPHVSRLVSPMVGRERERRRLHDAFEQAVGDRTCQLFTVLGPAGVGKSRLVQEFLGDLAGRALVARGRCLAYGEGITYWPVSEAVREAVGLEETESPEAGLEQLARVLEGEQDAEVIAQRVAEVIGLAEAEGGAEEGFAAVRELFEALAHSQPLVLVFDDIHWGETTFLDLVEHLADWTRNAPILLVCLARPELLDVRPGWGGGKLNATSVLLEPLSEAQCCQLIENLVGQAELAEEVESRIAASAEGNPLFVEEMLSMLIDDGLLVRENGRWTAVGDIGAVRVPATIHALLAARLDRLGADERAVIERAAVAGKVFGERAVVELAPEALRPTVSTSLGSLVLKELIRPERSGSGAERTYRFRHLLIRDAAYDSIPKEARAELHERFARRLEQVAGPRAIESEELLGYHLEQAYRYRAELGPVDDDGRLLAAQAAGWLSSAARRAFGRGDMRAAANLLGRAASLLEGEAAARLELLPELAKALRYSGETPAAEAVLAEAVEDAARLGDARLEAMVEVESAYLTLYTDPGMKTAEVIRAAEHAAGTFAELEDELGLAKAWSLVGDANWLLCHGAKMEEAFERALAHLQRAGDPRERWWILSRLLNATVFGPTPPESGIQRCHDLLALGEGARGLEMTAAAAIASLEAMRGNFATARELYLQSRAIGEELGLARWLATLPNMIGPIEMLAGDLPVAERELRFGYESLQSLGDTGTLSTTAAVLSRAIVLQGRYADAEAFTVVSEQAASPDDLYSQIVWRGARARALAHRGELESAEALARAGVAIGAETDFLNLRGESLLDLADVLAEAGDEEESRDALREALALFEEKGCVVLADRTRALLDPVHGVELQS